MIRGLDHLGIAVKSLEERLPFWADALALDVAGIETVQAEGVKVALLQVGKSRIELLEALTADSPIGKFIERRGEGIHHITLAVDDIDAALDRVRVAKIRIVGQAPRDGVEGSKIAFLHPASTGGVLVELVQQADATRAPTDIVPGHPVLVYLREPQEKMWGILRRLDASGLVVEGIDLTSFDDWVAQIERGEDSVVGPSVLFVPSLRLEKILLDRSSGKLPSLADRFQGRTGRRVQDVLDAAD
jgi:methylmalonyl-CoA/ethylmalonyl-CoA epimerase